MSEEKKPATRATLIFEGDDGDELLLLAQIYAVTAKRKLLAWDICSPKGSISSPSLKIPEGITGLPRK